MKPKRLNSEWTPRDLQRMRALARRGVSAKVAAAELGRSRGAVAFKAMKQGVSFHAINQPRGAQRKALRTRRRNERRAKRAA